MSAVAVIYFLLSVTLSIYTNSFVTIYKIIITSTNKFFYTQKYLKKIPLSELIIS